MPTFLAIGLSLAGLIALLTLTLTLLKPWMARWGANTSEIEATLPGDELLQEPARVVNRAIHIQAPPEAIYPWLLQLGAGKGGFYSYTWIERLVSCPIVNANRIHPEWQTLQVGDEVKMCPNRPVPPPYIVAQILPNRAIVMGHQDQGQWVDLWQFVLLPQADHSTRLILRTRTMMTGGIWDVIYPGVFLMERGMLRGICKRAQANNP